MRYLLDVNCLVAAILDSHTQHEIADRWLAGKSLATCPLAETGFLRIVTHPKIYGVAMPVAREALGDFISRHEPLFVPDDLKALKSLANFGAGDRFLSGGTGFGPPPETGHVGHAHFTSRRGNHPVIFGCDESAAWLLELD